MKSESSDSVFSDPSPVASVSGGGVTVAPVAVPSSVSNGHFRRSSDVGAVFAVPSPPYASPASISTSAAPTTANFNYGRQRGAPGKDASSAASSRKKKAKAGKAAQERAGKTRTIKFHEYKVSHKSCTESPSVIS
jgi:hypothetical protein